MRPPNEAVQVGGFMISTIKKTRYNDEIELSLSHDDVGDTYIVYIDVFNGDVFVLNLLTQEVENKLEAINIYNEKHKQIEMLYTKC